MEDAIELIFVPAPSVSHLVPAVQTAKLLLQRRPQLSITFLVMKMVFAPESKVNSLIDSLIADAGAADDKRLKFKLVLEDLDLDHAAALKDLDSINNYMNSGLLSEARDYCVNELITQKSRPRLAGFVIDIFYTRVMDLADEFGVPTYVFYVVGAAMLGLAFHFQSLKDQHHGTLEEFIKEDYVNIPTYLNPFPVKLLPSFVLNTTDGVLDWARQFRRAKGIIPNTFFDLEPYAFQFLSKDKTIPPIYPLGPVLNLNTPQESHNQIFKWLDDQPASSVVFLCFGSGCAFPEPQVKEIAYALERSGQRFLWALRKLPSPGSGSLAVTEYTNLEEVLPEGFLERTKSIGKVLGWAPQSAILAHPSVGGFVSHCGWNSVLESSWFGVPMATWPMIAEQQANAFQVVREIGMGVEIKIDYRTGFRDPKNNNPIVPKIVSAKEIEIGITNLMDHSTSKSIRMKAKEVKEKSRKALEEGGSCFNVVESFFENVMKNLN
ncbi:PREDICTED: anthocyanidin 3-O-glucosyltransferase 2-like [Ipomoea nil]|uniref:anthocyanidin 3-O-glucosyltransferase 2-like n=1 Tax=Ipomoea nil TaxID=35883 RepID=UPI000900CC64|nr:PREDICTED: anthocyanidin 3-O-glucosyltransferase 2-like [Ipomoea nil]